MSKYTIIIIACTMIFMLASAVQFKDDRTFAFSRPVPQTNDPNVDPEPTVTYWGFEFNAKFAQTTLESGPKHIVTHFPGANTFPNLDLDLFAQKQTSNLIVIVQLSTIMDIVTLSVGSTQVDTQLRTITLKDITSHYHSDKINWSDATKLMLVFTVNADNDVNMPPRSWDEFCGFITVDGIDSITSCTTMTAHALITLPQGQENRSAISFINNILPPIGSHHNGYLNVTLNWRVTPDKQNKWGFANYWRLMQHTVYIEPINTHLSAPVSCYLAKSTTGKWINLELEPTEGNLYIADVDRPYVSEFGYDYSLSCNILAENTGTVMFRVGVLDTEYNTPSVKTVEPENYSEYLYDFSNQ